ncbi:MAG: aspartate kinase, partial [Clostridia bacterium]|nr:aspartate kinase [Clostridia bacterium]
MRIIIQKFGGTSLNTPELRQAAARHILDAIRDGYWPVVVVSAMGRAGEPYATDTLIQLASAIYPDTPSRELDLLLSCGEIISAVLFSNTLRASGAPPPVVLTGGQAGIITDRRFGDARILRVEPDHLNRHLERGDLCVVAGFQGVAETGDITTLG